MGVNCIRRGALKYNTKQVDSFTFFFRFHQAKPKIVNKKSVTKNW